MIVIEATTLPDAWFQSVYNILDHGVKYTNQQGSFEGQERLQLPYFVCKIEKPYLRPLIPEMPEGSNIPQPCTQDFLDQYLPYLMTAEKQENESYTYGQRINEAVLFGVPLSKDIICSDFPFLNKNDFIKNKVFDGIGLVKVTNQIQILIERLKLKRKSNQDILQIAQPSDLLLADPPCLRHIDIFLDENDCLNFFPYFRSWDLWSGFPANLAAIQLLKEYMAQEIGCNDGYIIASSPKLHLYHYTYELAQMRTGRSLR